MELMGGLAGAALYFTRQGHYIFQHEHDGQVLTKCLSARDVAAAFGERDEDTGWLPAGILRAGYGKNGVWYVYQHAPTIVTIRLTQEDSGGSKAAEQELRIPVPGTLMVGIGATYYLFCWHGVSSPGAPAAGAQLDLAGALFRAPFPNVNTNGNICFGRNPLAVTGAREATPEAAQHVWELFFATPFNADLTNGKCKTFPKDVRKLLRRLDGAEIFPQDELIVHEKTLKDYVERLIEREVK